MISLVRVLLCYTLRSTYKIAKQSQMLLASMQSSHFIGKCDTIMSSVLYQKSVAFYSNSVWCWCWWCCCCFFFGCDSVSVCTRIAENHWVKREASKCVWPFFFSTDYSHREWRNKTKVRHLLRHTNTIILPETLQNFSHSGFY